MPIVVQRLVPMAGRLVVDAPEIMLRQVPAVLRLPGVQTVQKTIELFTDAVLGRCIRFVHRQGHDGLRRAFCRNLRYFSHSVHSDVECRLFRKPSMANSSWSSRLGSDGDAGVRLPAVLSSVQLLSLTHCNALHSCGHTHCRTSRPKQQQQASVPSVPLSFVRSLSRWTPAAAHECCSAAQAATTALVVVTRGAVDRCGPGHVPAPQRTAPEDSQGQAGRTR